MNLFLEGGFGMFPTLALGAVSLALAVRYAWKRDSAPLVVGFGAATLLAGALGFVMGARLTLSAAAQAALTRSDYPTLVLAGISESLANLVLALALLVPVALVTAVGGFRAQRIARLATAK